MTNLFATIQENLFLIKLCFSGTYKKDSSGILMEDDIFDMEIPTYLTDRNNLRIDRNKVSQSYRDAVNAKQLELTQ